MDRRKDIIKAAKEQPDGRFSLEDAVQWIGHSYYANERKHTGDVLSRMVKAGLLKREKPGVFVLIRTRPRKGSIDLAPDGPEVLSLF